MPDYTDQTGRTISLNKIPQRIISLVPSQTELLADLGLEEEVAGITKFCIHPETWFRTKPRVGGTKQLTIDKIHALKPDLIIANKEENVKEQVEELAKHYPVWISDVTNLENACEMIHEVGKMTNKEQPAIQIINRIKKNFSQLPTTNSGLSTPNSPLRTIYLIWRNPYMTIGHDTFIHVMMEAAGFNNVSSDKTRYPEVSLQELQSADCQLILLSSEPFPFRQKHVEELRAQGVKAQILLVDGEMFSWYGSRLLQVPRYITELKKQVNQR